MNEFSKNIQDILKNFPQDAVMLINTDLKARWRLEFWGTLHWAIHYGFKDIVGNELEKGADVNQVIEGCRTPLHHALDVDYFRRDIVEVLLSYHPNMNLKDETSNTPLNKLVALYYTEINLVKKFLEKGADPNIPDSFGFTPLHLLSIWLSDLDELIVPYMELFTKYKVNIHGQDNFGDTPLHHFVRCSSKITQYLLDQDADIYTKNDLGYTQMDIAFDDRMFGNESFDMIAKQAIILEFCKIPMKPNHSKVIMNIPSMQIFRENCHKEILTLKSVKVVGSTISLNDILNSSTNKLANILRNENIVEWLQNFNEKDYIFGKRLYYHFRKGLARRKVMDRFHLFCSKLFPGLPNVCLENIIEFLTNEDLENVIKVFTEKCRTS